MPGSKFCIFGTLSLPSTRVHTRIYYEINTMHFPFIPNYISKYFRIFKRSYLYVTIGIEFVVKCFQFF